MARSHVKGNPELLRAIRELRIAARSHDAPLWAAVADGLERARHPSRPVSVGQLDRVTAAEETVVVPGKVLSDGMLSKRLTVGAFSYSTEARAKIHAAGGTALTLHDLVKANPNGAGVRIVG
jgi:large subunit ribosomal protein L18e